jgi:hypothetical protein
MMEEYKFEEEYWDKGNIWFEERKHYSYAKFMGIKEVLWSFDVENKSILDIGGGPCSMLLKCRNLKRGKVVDPIEWPLWVKERYKHNKIELQTGTGEDINETGWDEVWIYNCMQHAIDAKKLIQNAKRSAKVLRIFEWIDVPPHEGHPIELTEDRLNEWINAKGKTRSFDEWHTTGLLGKAYYGAFTYKE